MSRMEMIFIDSDNHARKTGVGAIFDTPELTWAAFRSAKRIAVPMDRAEFLLDYYNRRDDLSDTIPLSRSGFEYITGQRALTDADYRRIDAEHWART